ncbi:MAG: hypothetical protein PHY34_02515 [Patescibacteria group bacterium]|nr:hypothetical protein [Patescibacteria group bacterium]MDD5715482.1 hypothetical protein [Patescibacteria group bacterium]
MEYYLYVDLEQAYWEITFAFGENQQPSTVWPLLLGKCIPKNAKQVACDGGQSYFDFVYETERVVLCFWEAGEFIIFLRHLKGDDKAYVTFIRELKDPGLAEQYASQATDLFKPMLQMTASRQLEMLADDPIISLLREAYILSSLPVSTSTQ